jgi:ACR3 family arsenite transporter
MIRNDKTFKSRKGSAEVKNLSFFEKYLSIWVILCIVVGVATGKFLPAFLAVLSRFEYAHVSIR